MPKPIAGFDLLAQAERQINDAKDQHAETRARVGTEVNATLKHYASTPAVVALRRRIYTELLDLNGDVLASEQGERFGLVADTPEPEGPTGGPSVSAPAVLSTGTPTGQIIVLFNEDGGSYAAYWAPQREPNETADRLVARDEFAYSYELVDLRPLPDLTPTDTERINAALEVLKVATPSDMVTELKHILG